MWERGQSDKSELRSIPNDYYIGKEKCIHSTSKGKDSTMKEAMIYKTESSGLTTTELGSLRPLALFSQSPFLKHRFALRPRLVAAHAVERYQRSHYW